MGWDSKRYDEGMDGHRRVVFAGAGHAHLHALARVKEYTDRGLEVVLVAPDRFWYSGMGPGLLSGLYRPEDDTVDVAELVTRGGGRYVQAPIALIDPMTREVALQDGTRLGYKVLSLNVGSEVPLDGIEGARELGVPVKPVRHLAELHDHWSTLPENHPALRVVVIGGGAAGCEVAANARRLLRDRGIPSRIILVTSQPRLLDRHPLAAHKTILRWLNRAAVEVQLSSQVRRLESGRLHLAGGDVMECDVALFATGVRPPPLLAESGLATAEDGALLVNDHLQSVSHPEVFGGGDCVTLHDRPLDRVGVYAVRQAPVLHGNVLAAASGGPLRRFKPQKRYLLILNLGDGTGLLLWHRWVVHAGWAFRVKDRLDRRFVARFRTRNAPAPVPSVSSLR